jgi:hypothetical protein
MASILHRSWTLCLIWITTFLSAAVSQNSSTTGDYYQYDDGSISSYCSIITALNPNNSLVINQDIPSKFIVTLLDQLCEDPACQEAGVDCLIGECSSCVYVTQDYSNATSVSFSCSNYAFK